MGARIVTEGAGMRSFLVGVGAALAAGTAWALEDGEPMVGSRVIDSHFKTICVSPTAIPTGLLIQCR
jgi:hypothetical protein